MLNCSMHLWEWKAVHSGWRLTQLHKFLNAVCCCCIRERETHISPLLHCGTRPEHERRASCTAGRFSPRCESCQNTQTQHTIQTSDQIIRAAWVTYMKNATERLLWMRDDVNESLNQNDSVNRFMEKSQTNNCFCCWCLNNRLHNRDKIVKLESNDTIFMRVKASLRCKRMVNI